MFKRPLLHALRATVLGPLIALAACSSGDRAAPDASGLATVFDSSTTDTVVARTIGAVPAAALRRAVEELRIAPGADDTSLFAEVFEFDVAADGRMYVFDQGGRAILLFGPDGALQRRIGRQGAGPGEFNRNGGMVVLPDTRLAQWDPSNGRISFFSAEGEFLTSWVLPTGFSTSNGLRTDSSGQILVYRPVTEPREGEILGRFGLVRLADGGVWRDSLVPPDLPVERVVYVARREGSTSATSPAHAPRFLWQWHPGGYFVSASTGAYRIEVGRPGRALRIQRDAPEIPVSDEERTADQERITFSMRQTEQGWVFRGPPIPATKPPIADLAVARDGRIWVRVATPSQEIPEEEREVQRPDWPPPRRWRDPVEYEVFAANGRFLGRVALPLTATWMEAEGDLVWYLTRDEDGLPAVVRARIEPALR